MSSDSRVGAAQAPAGVTVDFDNPTDALRTVNYVTQALSIVIVTVFVCLKHYAKASVLRGTWNIEDYITYFSYVLFVGYCIDSIFASQYGGGLNQWEVTTDQISYFLKTGYAATIFYAPMAFSVKMALLLIIARVFGSVHKKTIMGIYVFMGLLGGYYFSALVVKIRICWPIHAYWEGDMSKCLDQRAIIIADAIVSAVSDLVILLLPTPLTWSLQLPVRKKLRVAGILCAGGVATAFSIYRLGLVIAEGNSVNQTVVFIKVILSGNAEVGLGVICACLPAVTALYTRRKGGSGYQSGGYHSGAYGNRSKGFPESSAAGTSKNKIYVNHSIHIGTMPRGEDEERAGSADQWSRSQDQIELVTNAQGVSESKWA
ncbi:hypothetical protein Daus18300_004347 [Diaporthe australafricana]|uniref:Rhodopsin domain-containing protein n=1 Tax=Diaporthe australafricana TaxID=127596 RepID=A0ABR3X9M3_9PEZI